MPLYYEVLRLTVCHTCKCAYEFAVLVAYFHFNVWYFMMIDGLDGLGNKSIAFYRRMQE